MKCASVSITVLLLVSGAANAQSTQEHLKIVTTNTYIKTGYSDWVERGDDKSLTMTEQSALISAGAEGTFSPFPNGDLLSWLAEATVGGIYYDGSELLSGIPRKAVELHAGFRVEAISHKCFVSNENASFGAFGGVGYTIFLKTVGPEIWNELYARVGLETSFHLLGTKIFMNGGIVQPIAVIDHGIHSNIGFTDGIYLPHGHMSAFGEIGLDLRGGRKFSVMYDSMNLGSSPAVKSHEIGGSRTIMLFQPDTRSYTVSLRFSYHFGLGR